MDPVHPPVRVQGEAGWAGITPREEEDIIEVAREQNWRQVTPGQSLPQYLQPNLRLRWLPKDIERSKRQADNPAFLTHLKRNVKRKCEELKDWFQESEVNPEHPLVTSMITCKQIEITMLQDCIRRVKDGCYHLQ